MKSIKALLATMIVCIVAFSSCKKDSSESNPTTTVSFKLDGTDKSTSTVLSAYDKNSKALLVSGSLSPSEVINISLENIQAGTFDVVNNGIVATYSNGASDLDTYAAISGTLTITSFTNNTVSGTFSFVVMNQARTTKNITEGKFSTNYVSQ